MSLLIALILKLFGKYLLYMFVVYLLFKDNYSDTTFVISTLLYIIYAIRIRYERYKDGQLQREYMMKQNEFIDNEMKRRYLEQEQEEMVTVKIPLEKLKDKFPEIYNKNQEEENNIKR